MNFSMPDFSIALPEIFMVCMACVVLLIDVFLKDRFRIVTYILVQVTLVVSFLISVYQYRYYPDPIITFSGSYVLDKLASLTKMFVLVASFFSFVYARHYTRERNIARGDYYSLGLFAVLGMQVMASAYSFLTIYLGLELVSLPLYAMVAMQKDSREASEAAMKYFVTGALASGLLLYGISLVYGAMGTLDISDLAKMIPHATSIKDSVLLLGLVFIFARKLFNIDYL